MPIIGDTDEQAKELLARLQSWLTPTNALALVSQRIWHDISGYPLDGPVPDLPKAERGQAFSTAPLETARSEKMTRSANDTNGFEPAMTAGSSLGVATRPSPR
jgi:hypothetical protein